MVKKLIAVLSIFVVLGSGLFAGEIDLVANKSGLEIITEKIDDSNNLRMRMVCSIDKLYFYDAETPKGNFTVLYSPEFYFGGNYGAPQLPVINKLVQIPVGSDYKIEVIGYDSKDYKLEDHGISSKIYPRQPSAPKDGSEVPFVYEQSAYMFKGFHGQETAVIEDIGVLRHKRLAHLAISPVKYDPIENSIRVYNNIEIEISFPGADIAATKAMHEARWSPAFSWLDKMVVSPKAISFGTRNVAQSYVIVSDPSFKEEIKPFADLKTKQGYIVDMVYTDQFGSDITTGVKDYLHNLFNNPTDEMPAPSYVLFVGDHNKIPAFKGNTGSHITDLYYATVTPGDFLPDFLTGRFSARNAEDLIPQIEKSMEYEQFLFPDPSFLNDVVLIAGWDSYWARSHGWPHLKYAQDNYINADNGFKNVSTYFSAGSHQNEAAIIADVAKGAAFVNYTAHGSPTTWADPKFTMNDIANLGNKGKYPFVIGNCCITNKFELSQCFGEAWLRAKDAGAIGYVGGSNNTYWDEDFWWGVGLHSIVKPNSQGTPPLKAETGPGAFEAMFEDGASNAGFMMAGNLAVEQSSSGRKRYYWEVYHLMGDPALRAYMGKPRNLRVNVESEIVDAETASIKVNAPAGSYVGISSNNSLLGAGYVCTEGYAIINLSSIPENGKAEVVVTAANSVPFNGTVILK